MSNLTMNSIGSSRHSVGATGSNSPVADTTTTTPRIPSTPSSSNSGTSLESRRISGGGNTSNSTGANNTRNMIDSILYHSNFIDKQKNDFLNPLNNVLTGIRENIGR